MNLKSLVHWELSQGMTEEQLASAVGVPLRTVTNILATKEPQSRTTWEKFGKYFRMHVDFLRTGESAYAKSRRELSSRTSAAGHIRNIPLVSWHQLGEFASKGRLPDPIHAEDMVEATDISGARTFALKVQDDSMEPLFSKGEMIFVNPDIGWKAGDFVVATHHDHSSAWTLLRQIKVIGHQCLLHPVNWKYEDLPFTAQDVVWGKVVRLRKNL
ncbi:MAG TPA: XRE family transcriptional regulator [Nitrospira sp.]|nr:XRE family transcriptional regulator [Nitrospira sp.]